MERVALDRRALEAELATAIEDEERRIKVDEMKKRAIGSARSYEEFKNLVACATLKPVSKQDLQELSKRSSSRAHNVLAARAPRDASASGASAAPALPSGVSATAAQPRSALEFDRDFTRSGPGSQEQLRSVPPCASALRPPDVTARVRSYMLSVKASRLERIFKVDLDAILLARMLLVLDAAWAADAQAAADRSTSRKVCKLLGSLTGLPRFDLALSFLSGEERRHASVVAAALRSAGERGCVDGEAADRIAARLSPAV